MGVVGGPAMSPFRQLKPVFGGSTILFTPSNLAVKPVIWYDAADTSQMAMSANKVSGIANKGTVAHILSQATASQQPTYSATARNGKPGLSFDASVKTFMATNNGVSGLPNGTGPSTTFVVSYSSVSTANNGYPFGFGGSNTTNARLINAGNPIKIDTFAAATSLTESSSLVDTIIVSSLSGSGTGASNAYVNGGAVENGSVGVATSTPAIVAIGRPVTVDSGYFTGVLQEVLVLDYIPTLTDQQKIVGYLAAKWGLQGLLPANDPYKNSAPTA